MCIRDRSDTPQGNTPTPGGENELPAISLEDYLYMEAKEKCFEIEIKSQKEFEKAKNEVVAKNIDSIKDYFEVEMRKKEAERRIVHSTAVNKSRLAKMQERNRALLKILNEAQWKLLQRIQSDATFYKQLLKKLVIQGLIKLMEEKIIVRCLERDIGLVKDVVDSARQEFLGLVSKELGDNDFPLEISVDDRNFLTERKIQDLSGKALSEFEGLVAETTLIQKNEDTLRCYGGVLVMNARGTIICKNTLDIRVEQCFQESLPDVRAALFPKPEGEARKPAPAAGHKKHQTCYEECSLILVQKGKISILKR
eukprot:TRINITY_DN3178_c0_g4_i1.p2 TRINITY_DN3178_c0_g4~~TRINITY_DN3178_c0_g4_i1.p2  ORF type:complete len:310 (-),score=107.32 TRINITY_DN3178_c0_g4_i1:802-1731(-)